MVRHEDYFKRGLRTIPLNLYTSMPAAKFSHLTDEMWDCGDVQDYYDRIFPVGEYGIGLLFGSYSKIMAVDIDLSDPQEILRVRGLLPSAVCEKFGSKGTTIFYEKGFDLNRKIILDKIEIFSGQNCYVAIPPSYNRKTKKEYIWIGSRLTKCIDQDLLPTFEESHLKRLEGLRPKRTGFGGNFGSMSGEGRNNWLVSQAGILAKQKHIPLEKKIDLLLVLDKEHHKEKAWFNDDKEHSGRLARASERARATFMMKRIQGLEDKNG